MNMALSAAQATSAERQISGSPIQKWHEQTPELVKLLGRQGFINELDALLHRIVPFDLACVFAYPGQKRPILLHDRLGTAENPEIIEKYLNGTYLLDAVYSACARKTPQGLYRLRDLAPDAFFEGEYYNSPDLHPCVSMESGALAEEIVFVVPLTKTISLAYSLMRKTARPAFSDDEMALLRTTAPMVITLLSRHWENVAFEHKSGDEIPLEDSEQMIEYAFRSFLPAQLTPREQTIVSLILRGHSSISIGSVLRIAEGTVKIHRKNIYAKLGISGQTELFNLFIKHLLVRTP